MAILHKERFFCKDLSTVPVCESGIILVTGGTGYIGGRLVPELLERGYKVRVLVRSGSDANKERWPGADIVSGDLLDPESLEKAMDGVYAAYYLIHSLLLGHKTFESHETDAAINFRDSAEKKGVSRVIYLGGLGDKNDDLSSHLRSRLRVAGELSKGTVPVTILRAAIIIGSGSASFEIIKNLVEKLPVLLIPNWAKTKCQPIGIRDVIKYLVGCLEENDTAGKEFDIGGEEVLTYENMMKIVADIVGKHRWLLKEPFFSISFYSYLTGFLTPVPAPIARALIKGLKNEVVCINTDIQKSIPFETISFREAVKRAMMIEDMDEIPSRWSDSYPPEWDLVKKFHQLKKAPRYSCSYFLISEKKDVSLFFSLCRIGGKEGWFYNNWMWRLRGEIDRVLMGVGMARGRRSQSTLREGDVIDFFRVEKLERDRRLLLRAEMKLPGLAWLEFRVDPNSKLNNTLRVSAYFEPKGLFGKLYWYFFLPFHYLIFTRLIQIIEKRSREPERERIKDD